MRAVTGSGPLVGFFFALLSLPGCSSGTGPKGPSELMGKITYKGAGVSGAKVTFIGGENSIPVATGADGSFVTRDIPVGEYVLTVEGKSDNAPKLADKASADAYNNMIAKGAAGGAAVVLPKKYAKKATSDLKWTVTAGKNEPKTFDLVD